MGIPTGEGPTRRAVRMRTGWRRHPGTGKWCHFDLRASLKSKCEGMEVAEEYRETAKLVSMIHPRMRCEDCETLRKAGK